MHDDPQRKMVTVCKWGKQVQREIPQPNFQQQNHLDTSETINVLLKHILQLNMFHKLYKMTNRKESD